MTDTHPASDLYECVRCPDWQPTSLRDALGHVRDAHGGMIRSSLRRHRPAAHGGQVPAPSEPQPDSGLVTVGVVLRLGEPPVPLTCYPVGAHLAVGPEIRMLSEPGTRRAAFTGGWCVYHQPTGLKVPGGIAVTAACLSHTLAFAQDLTRCDVDWSRADAAGYRSLRTRFETAGVGAAFAACNHPYDCDDAADELSDPFADDEDDQPPPRWWRRLVAALRRYAHRSR